MQTAASDSGVTNWTVQKRIMDTQTPSTKSVKLLPPSTAACAVRAARTIFAIVIEEVHVIFAPPSDPINSFTAAIGVGVPKILQERTREVKPHENLCIY